MGGQNAAIPIGKYYEKYGKYVLSADTKINDESLTITDCLAESRCSPFFQ